MISVRLVVELAAALIVGLAFWWYSAHERGIGEQKIVTLDSRSVAAQAAKDQATINTEVAVTRQEAKEYASAINTAINNAPVVGVCLDVPSSPVYPASQADYRPGTDGLASVRGASPALPAVLKWDTSPVVQIGHDADAQVAGLQDYIRRVCPTL